MFDSDIATFDAPNEAGILTYTFSGQMYDTFVKWKWNTNYVQVNYSPNFRTAQKPLLNCLGADDTIYVVGHGFPGADSISPFVDSNLEAELSSAAVVFRLEELGLQKNSHCKLKLFTCHSGVQRGQNHSFARRVRDQLRDFEYHQIRVFGYTDSVSGYQRIWGSNRKRAGGQRPASEARIEILDQIPSIPVV